MLELIMLDPDPDQDPAENFFPILSMCHDGVIDTIINAKHGTQF